MPSREQIFRRKVDEILKQIETLEQQAVADTFKLLDKARQEIISELAQASGWELHHLEQVKASIEQAIDDYFDRFTAQVRRQNKASWNLGVDLVDKPIASVGINMTLPSLDIRALEAIQAGSLDYIKGLTADTVGAIRQELNWVLIGRKTPQEAMKAISRSLDDPGIFNSTWLRAEKITINELNYAFSVSSQERLNEAAKWVDDLGKQWDHSRNPNFRKGHREIDGQVRGVNELYDVPVYSRKGVFLRMEKLMHPRDRQRGSAENTINCGCDSRPHLKLAA